MKTDGSTAILMASFGTTHPDALERCIAGTERSVAARFPELLWTRWGKRLNG